MSLSHFNKKNKNIEMVDISKKNKTKRYAEAKSRLKIDRKLFFFLRMIENYKITYIIQLN